jgi:hypothetical protein
MTRVSSGQASVRCSGLQPVKASAFVLGLSVQRPPPLQVSEASIMKHVPAVLSEIIKYECLTVSHYVWRLTKPDDTGETFIVRPSAYNFLNLGKA